MSRVSLFSAPFLLGFDAFEERMERLAKAADGYPPFNIERHVGADDAEMFFISIAVAGFASDELDVVVEDNQLIVRGRQADAGERHYLHRGIATRQFQRAFMLADTMVVEGAELRDGLLIITALRPKPEKTTRKIDIVVKA